MIIFIVFEVANKLNLNDENGEQSPRVHRFIIESFSKSLTQLKREFEGRTYVQSLFIIKRNGELIEFSRK